MAPRKDTLQPHGEGMKKALQDMTLEELWELFPISLVPHDNEWSQWAADEIAALSELLAADAPVISHIGSTAIPDIKAKPIIDILVELPGGADWQSVKHLLEHNGYICMAERPGKMSFNKGYTPEGYAERVFHIHIHNAGDRDELIFRDYLLAHPHAAREYEALKLSLLPKFRNNRDAYTDAKTEFVTKTVAAAKSQQS